MDLALQDDSDGDGETAPPVWEGERVISRALLMNDRVVFSTVIPDPDPCAFGGTGWLMELSALDGARLDQSPFDLNNDGVFDADDYVSVKIPGDNDEPKVVAVPISGKKSKVGIIKTPAVIKKRKTDKEFKYTSGSSKYGRGLY
jgi:type IV pilus assembly protein PilY1